MCYHNFKTNEKIFEHHMTDTRLKEICRANFHAEVVSFRVRL